MKVRSLNSKLALSALALIGVTMAVAHARADEKEPKGDFDLAEFLNLKTTLDPEDVRRIYDEKGLAGLQELDIYLSRTLKIKHTKDNEDSFESDEKIEVKTSEDRNTILIPRKTKLAIVSFDSRRDVLTVDFDKEIPGSELAFVNRFGKYRLAAVPQKAGYNTTTYTTLIRSALGAPRLSIDHEDRIVLRVMKKQKHEVTTTKRKAKGGK
jgi:hypothetical protein